MAQIQSPKFGASTLRHFTASGVEACSVKRICIFGACRNTRSCPSKTAWRVSLAQLTSVALPYVTCGTRA